jgi:3-dehydroquinate synthase
MAAESLRTLPPREWKSGMAELIKTAVLSPDGTFFEELRSLFGGGSADNAGGDFSGGTGIRNTERLLPLIERALAVKGSIAGADPRETGGGRALLNLGHSFGHALESVLGLGTVSHGEAVAWGMARSCELGQELGITPPDRARAILDLLTALGCDLELRLPAGSHVEEFRAALLNDKKKRAGKPRFVVPAAGACGPDAAVGAVLVDWDERVEAYINRLCSLLFP